MNEDQRYNDHKLHISPCVCGNLHPEVMGDDFDADVGCNRCGANTEVYRGTKSAILAWNEGKIKYLPEYHGLLTMPSLDEFKKWIDSSYLNFCTKDVEKLYETLKSKCG